MLLPLLLHQHGHRGDCLCRIVGLIIRMGAPAWDTRQRARRTISPRRRWDPQATRVAKIAWAVTILMRWPCPLFHPSTFIIPTTVTMRMTCRALSTGRQPTPTLPPWVLLYSGHPQTRDRVPAHTSQQSNPRTTPPLGRQKGPPSATTPTKCNHPPPTMP